MRKLMHLAAASFMLAMPALAQDATNAERKPADKEFLLKSLDRALPRWGDDILKTPDSKDWAGDLSLPGVVRSLGADEFISDLRQAPNGAETIKSKAGVVRIDAKRGYVRYENNTRVPDLRGDVGKLPSEEQAFQIGLKALSRLGVPAEEFDKPKIATQIAAGGSTEAQKPERIDEVYRLFVAKRSINSLPVFGSNVMVAITARGEVQRLKTQWPAFRMEGGDMLLGREEVLARAADTLADQGLSEKTELSAQIGYAPIADIPGSAYIPVALVSANDGPTPVLVSVPLVAPGDKDER
jgi:hypothetical protein